MAAKAKKLLYKSVSNRIVSGVLGGVGEYFGIDPVIVRAFFVLLTAFSGFMPGVVAYVALALIIPEK